MAGRAGAFRLAAVAFAFDLAVVLARAFAAAFGAAFEGVACAVLALAGAFCPDGEEELAEEASDSPDFAWAAAADGLAEAADRDDLGALAVAATGRETGLEGAASELCLDAWAEVLGWAEDLAAWAAPVRGSARARSTGSSPIPFATGKPQCSNSA